MIHIYIVSLVEDIERRKHVLSLQKKIEDKHIQCTIVDAYYWKSHDIQQILRERGFTYSYSVSLSQHACFLSHYKVWEMISNTDPTTKSIIIEDDMDLQDHIDIGELEKGLPSLYDYIYLWKHPEQVHNQPAADPTYPNVSPFYYTWGTTAYMITPMFAKELLHIKDISMPIDQILLQTVLPNHIKNVYVSVKDYFKNLGFLGGSNYDSSCKFKSNIWD